MKIETCMLTKNDCYKAGKTINPTGIIVHSTGANNPELRRYVQPDDGFLGKNQYSNDWNRSGVSKCVHAFIGKDKNGAIKVYQTLPWNMRCWGCGSGSKGSYNSSHIQFEICEDAMNDVNYFNEAFKLATELCAVLCKKYGIKTENIVSHSEAHAKGYATNHGDCDYWLKKFGKSMSWFRKQVDNIVNPHPVCPYSEPTVTLKSGDKGEGVKWCQWHLIQAGFLESKNNLDGIYGSKTIEAVNKLQTKYPECGTNGKPDGKCGKGTRAKLKSLV